MMQWRISPNQRYTMLCKYIDDNMEKLRVPGEYPEVEELVYNYLYLTVKAIAIKKRMFTNFADYDPFALFTARQLFFAFRRNLENQGKTIKGKKIVPIKSSLNYLKKVLNPRKLDYQQESFKQIISEEFANKKFDAFKYSESLKASVSQSAEVTTKYWDNLKETLTNIDDLVERVMKDSMFIKGSVDYKKIKMSLLLNCAYQVQLKKRLDTEMNTIILWKLPKSMAQYVRVLLKKLYAEIKIELVDCYKAVEIRDEVAEKVLTYKEGSDYSYEAED